ncbi:MAG: YfbR-like 5'-deoxynucleotidase [Candidatus Kerfeldbacteria bacterium]
MNKENFPNIKELFKNFEGRKKMLRGIKRYNIRPVMFYRPDLYTHSLHLGLILHDLADNINQVFGDKVDIEKTILMGLIHDDLELVMGDIQAAHKARMTPEQTAELLETESKAITEISQKFPKKIGNYNYESLLREGNDRKTIEARLMHFADQLDGLCESLHEVYGGNKKFELNIVTDGYGAHPSPTRFYVQIISDFSKNYPEIQPLFETKHPFLTPLPTINFKKTVLKNKPHTKQSILNNVGYTLYDHWRKIIREYADEKLYSNLYLKQE